MRQHYPSMLLTAYSGDPRIPLAGVLKYTGCLKKAILTHHSMEPKSGTCTHTLINCWQCRCIQMISHNTEAKWSEYHSCSAIPRVQAVKCKLLWHIPQTNHTPLWPLPAEQCIHYVAEPFETPATQRAQWICCQHLVAIYNRTQKSPLSTPWWVRAP